MKQTAALIVILTVFVFISCNKQAEPIAQFRGPDRSGIFHDSSLLKAWPENGPEEVFYIDSIGNGYGSPAIVDEMIYFVGVHDSTAYLYCADKEGNKLWSYALGAEWMKNYPGARSTPTVLGDLVYVGTGMGDLYCVDRNRLELVWSKSLKDDFDGILPRFGHSESPAIHNDMVFWTAGGQVDNVVAMDRFTGEVRWSATAKKERSAYHPPRVISTPSGRNILVTFSAYHLMGFDVETGELLWVHEQDNYPVEERKPGIGDTHSNTVIYDDGAIYYAAGDGNCGVKLSITDDGSAVSEIWRNKLFDSYMGGIVKIDGHIYGSGTANSQLFSIDAETGEITDSLKIGRGVVIAADNMLYYYSQTGAMHLVAYDNGDMERVGSFRIKKGSGEHFSHPAIDNGVLYVRRGNAMMGYAIKK
ncbi:MAG: PQQ-binding-like beta-propeller repeat protein [Bacteroidales bacterium]|nr:PQQ-binding-like beta-propeller repeat protein [Bacteroidales bacterium]